MAATSIHHLNYVVRDLDEAVERFSTILGGAAFETLEHAARNASIARARVGETWLVLVCPHDAESVPGKFLARHGEGFFLLSFATDDLGSELDRLALAGESPGEVRAGILDWQVADVAEAYGSWLQFTDETRDRGDQ